MEPSEQAEPELVRVPQERGDLVITREVVAAVVARAAAGAPGLVQLGPLPRPGPRGPRWLVRLRAWLRRLVGRERPAQPGVALELGEGEVAVALVVVARTGVDLATLARALRERVTRAVRGATGLDVRCCDVAVVDLRGDEPPARSAGRLDAAAEARRRFALDEPATSS